MDLFEAKPADLLNAWREAVRAADLGDRLAADADEAAAAADLRATAAVEFAQRAEQAATAATRAAERAAATATEAAALAKKLHEDAVPVAERIVGSLHQTQPLKLTHSPQDGPIAAAAPHG